MTLIFFVSPISKRIFYFYLLPALSVKGSCGKLIQTFSEGVSGIVPPPALAGAVLAASRHRNRAYLYTTISRNEHGSTTPPCNLRESKKVVSLYGVPLTISALVMGGVPSRCSALIRSNLDRVLKKTVNRCIWL